MLFIRQLRELFGLQVQIDFKRAFIILLKAADFVSQVTSYRYKVLHNNQPMSIYMIIHQILISQRGKSTYKHYMF